MRSKATAIMGFGNPCRSDDAIGIYVIDQLRKYVGEEPNISILDMGTSAFEVLYQLKGHQKIILVDAVVNTGEQIGTLYKVPAQEVMTANSRRRHGCSLQGKELQQYHKMGEIKRQHCYYFVGRVC